MAEEEMNYDIALLVDGPNMFRVGFENILSAVRGFGTIRIAEVYFNIMAGEPLITAATYLGYKSIVNGTTKDVDTLLAVRGAEIIASRRFDFIDLLAIASSDSDFLPLIYLAREYTKKEVLAVGINNESFSDALKNTADYIISLEERVKNGGGGYR